MGGNGAVIDQPAPRVKGHWTGDRASATWVNQSGKRCRRGTVAASRRSMALGLVALAVLILAFTLESEAGMQRFQWQNRPLIVLAPSAETSALRQQLEIAQANAAGWRERDMVTIVIAGDQPVTVDGTRAKDLANDALRQRYGVTGTAFATILVGKDGTEKLRHDGPISASKLFQTIDAMPMRRREMRDQGTSG